MQRILQVMPTFPLKRAKLLFPNPRKEYSQRRLVNNRYNPHAAPASDWKRPRETWRRRAPHRQTADASQKCMFICDGKSRICADFAVAGFRSLAVDESQGKLRPLDFLRDSLWKILMQAKSQITSEPTKLVFYSGRDVVRRYGPARGRRLQFAAESRLGASSVSATRTAVGSLPLRLNFRIRPSLHHGRIAHRCTVGA